MPRKPNKQRKTKVGRRRFGALQRLRVSGHIAIGPTAIAILAVLQRPGIPPTLMELSRAVGVAAFHAVQNHLDKLKSLGLVAWEGKVDNRAARQRTLRATCRFVPESEL